MQSSICPQHATRRGILLGYAANRGTNRQKSVSLNWILPSLPSLSCTEQCTSGKETWVVCWTDISGVWIGKKVFTRKYAWKSQTVVLNSILVSEEHRLKNKVTVQPGTPHHKVNRKEYSCITNKN